ncbi:MAG: hypothetical protein EOO07_29665, partial [Chitinophagaceae bacterium]
IFLTPLKKNSLTFGVTGTSKSNNFVGSEVKLTQTTRNLFRGAEQLDISVSGGFETQISGLARGLNSFSFTTEAKLTFPQFIVPFYKPKSTTAFIPKTVASLSYQLLNRGSEYSLNAFKAELGYNWKENIRKEHTFNPISVNFVKAGFPSRTTRDSLFDVNPVLRSSLENQFIIGSNYTFNYNEASSEAKWVATNINFNIDLSGNTLGLLTGAFKKNSSQKTLFGIPYAQYLRLSTSVSNFWRLNSAGLTWANRLTLGYGYAYGNSQSMPFVKQFFIGGSNSIRAFRARTLGPGSYQSESSQFFASEAGDVKAELNSEIRTKLFSIVNAAAFVDAGNIWLRKENPQKPGSSLQGFYKDIAVGAGVGLRFDASILVVRFDLAFPLRKPWLPEKERWVIDKVSFGDTQWRRDNLVLNIAIGYPF